LTEGAAEVVAPTHHGPALQCGARSGGRRRNGNRIRDARYRNDLARCRGRSTQLQIAVVAPTSKRLPDSRWRTPRRPPSSRPVHTSVGSYRSTGSSFGCTQHRRYQRSGASVPRR
jgi:hypothetical protein